MSDDREGARPNQLRALLIPPQEEQLRARFDLAEMRLELITSGWHRLVITAGNRVFVFPRNDREIPGIEREAQVLTQARPAIAPRLLGLHHLPGISPYPFLELSRIPGRPYDSIIDQLTDGDAAAVLADLGRQIARWHGTSIPESLRAAPAHREPPRIAGRWVDPASIEETVDWAADLLAPHVTEMDRRAWLEALNKVAAMSPVTVHGELSEGQFLINHDHRITGVVDWDALHCAHPLIDFNFGVGGVGVHRDSRQLRHHLWQAYTAERGGDHPTLTDVEIFWGLLDATTLINTDPTDPRLPQALALLGLPSISPREP